MQEKTSEMKEIDFTTFVLSVASAVFMGLGLTPKPGSSSTEIDIDLARHNISILEMLKEKTKNNLKTDEVKLLDGILYETRMKFVEAQRNRKG